MDIFKTQFMPYMEEDGGAGADANNNNPANPELVNNANAEPEKTFTQEQVNSMIAAEKRKQSSAAYKAMGFDSEEAAKSFIEKYKKQEEDAKSELQKAQDRAAELEAEQSRQAEETLNMKYQLDAIKAGCPVESVEDIVILAKAKMTDDVDFESAVEAVKKQYPSIFTGQEKPPASGTGTGGTPPKGRITPENITGIGKRLALEKAKQAGLKYEE